MFDKLELNYLVERIRSELPVIGELHLRFGDCQILVQSNSDAVISGLRRYFSAFIASPSPADSVITVHQSPDVSPDIPLTPKPPDPGKPRIKEEYLDIENGRIVRKRLTGMMFIFGGEEHVAVGPCLENLNQVVNFINNRYIEWRICRNGLLGHAAGVRIHDKGLALAGFSGMGKTTLALHMVGKGADFVSNDRLILEKTDPCIWMHGVGKLPRVNPGTILNNPNLKGLLSPQDHRRFSALSRDDLWKLEYKYDVPIAQCFGDNHFILSTPMDALIILNWKHENRPAILQEVNIAQRRDLLPAFMKSTGLFFLPDRRDGPPDVSEDFYVRFLKWSHVLEITGGINFESATDACIYWARHGKTPCRISEY